MILLFQIFVFQALHAKCIAKEEGIWRRKVDCARKMELVEDSTSDSGESVVFLNSSDERKISDRRAKEEQILKVEEKNIEPKCNASKPKTNVLKCLVPAKSMEHPCGDSVKETNTREKSSRTEIVLRYHTLLYKTERL